MTALPIVSDDDGPYCPKCGCELEWEECHEWGCEEGYIQGEYLAELDPLWYDEDDDEWCESCQGKGGSYWCPMCEEFKSTVRR